MNKTDFEALLNLVVEQLGKEVRESSKFHGPKEFEKRVFEVLQSCAEGQRIKISPTFHPHAFPDIIANGFGVEVKTTTRDSWLSVGNSVFEGTRDPSVSEIYVMFGKMGGLPSVRWGRYEERITHVRISHAPRFVLEMDRESSIFEKMGISYEEFSKLSPEEKMQHVRNYSRGRLKPGERLWWLEDDPQENLLPVEIKMFMDLTKEEKRRLRAEAAILCPQICGGSRQKTKYYDVSTFLLRVHGVLAPQTRDLFSAGSVAMKDGVRGGNHLLRALKDIEIEMRNAAMSLEPSLFIEYWGESVPPEERIKRWLALADRYAQKLKPSEYLFRDP